MKVLATLIALVAVLAFAPAMASAIVVDFSGAPAGNLDSNTTTIDGIVVDAFHFDITSSTWIQTSTTTLFRRNESPNDVGLGVCSGAQQDLEACNSATTPPLYDGSGGGDANEIDNVDLREMIRITLPAGFSWVSVSLSSLDCNAETDCTVNPETALINYGFSTADLGSTDPGLNLYTPSANDGNINPTFSLAPGPAQFATYLYFLNTHSGDGDTNNDFLLWKAEIIADELGGTAEDTGGVPGPATLLLLGGGLLVASRLRFRR